MLQKLGFGSLSPSPSKPKKGRSALSSTTLIRQTESELRKSKNFSKFIKIPFLLLLLAFEKSRNISPFGNYQNTTSFTENIFEPLDKKLLGSLVEEAVTKNLEEYKAKIVENLIQDWYFLGFYYFYCEFLSIFTQMKDFTVLKQEMVSKVREKN